jgi:hypothetical protein
VSTSLPCPYNYPDGIWVLKVMRLEMESYQKFDQVPSLMSVVHHHVVSEPTGISRILCFPDVFVGIPFCCFLFSMNVFYLFVLFSFCQFMCVWLTMFILKASFETFLKMKLLFYLGRASSRKLGILSAIPVVNWRQCIGFGTYLNLKSNPWKKNPVKSVPNQITFKIWIFKSNHW